MKDSNNNDQASEIEVILGNSNPRFSGVTSTMLQTLGVQKSLLNLRVMGHHHLPDPSLSISFWDAVRLCRKPLKSGKWRVFHARRNDEMIQALLLKHLFGGKIKIVFTSTAQRHHSRFTRWLMGKMDAVISTCQAAASYLKTKPAAIIPHGIEHQRYFPADNRAESWKALGHSGEFGIGIFGRVREQKGVRLFVQACIDQLPHYPKATALIVGAISAQHQSFVDELKEKIRQAGLENRILFLGEQPFERIPVLFRSMHVIAALSHNEGYGLTPLEAMASGAAVLTSEAGAWKEIIRDGIDGFVTPTGDQSAISARLGEMLSDPEALEKMGHQGRESVLASYTVGQEAEKLVAFYRSL